MKIYRGNQTYIVKMKPDSEEADGADKIKKNQN